MLLPHKAFDLTVLDQSKKFYILLVASSGDSSDLYSRGFWFESRPELTLSGSIKWFSLVCGCKCPEFIKYVLCFERNM
jgi:hypothetical protein